MCKKNYEDCDWFENERYSLLKEKLDLLSPGIVETDTYNELVCTVAELCYLDGQAHPISDIIH